MSRKIVAGIRRTQAASPEPDLAPRETESWEGSRKLSTQPQPTGSRMPEARTGQDRTRSPTGAEARSRKTDRTELDRTGPEAGLDQKGRPDQTGGRTRPGAGSRANSRPRGTNIEAWSVSWMSLTPRSVPDVSEEPPGPALKPSWKRPGPSRKLLGASGGPSWDRLGTSWGRLRAVLEPSEAVLARLQNVLKPICMQNGAKWVHSILATIFG